MLFMLVTAAVFHDDMSTLNAAQSLNIADMFVTDEVAHPATFESFNEEHSRNISEQLVTPAGMDGGTWTRLAHPRKPLSMLVMPICPKERHRTNFNLLLSSLVPVPWSRLVIDPLTSTVYTPGEA
jgi:hypothetical protein